MQQHINYHIWFKVCKPLKGKYNLSTNCLMVLNGCYIYNKHIKANVSRWQLLKFVSYYNNKKIGEYMTVLMKLGFIVVSGKYGMYDLYSISELGIKVINELNENYKKEFDKFVLLYGVSL